MGTPIFFSQLPKEERDLFYKGVAQFPTSKLLRSSLSLIKELIEEAAPLNTQMPTNDFSRTNRKLSTHLVCLDVTPMGLKTLLDNIQSIDDILFLLNFIKDQCIRLIKNLSYAQNSAAYYELFCETETSIHSLNKIFKTISINSLLHQKMKQANETQVQARDLGPIERILVSLKEILTQPLFT